MMYVNPETPVEDMEFHTRTITLLKRHGVATAKALSFLTEKEVLRWHNAGRMTWREIHGVQLDISFDRHRPSMMSAIDQAAMDVSMYGVGFMKIDRDGKFTRLDPHRVLYLAEDETDG